MGAVQAVAASPLAALGLTGTCCKAGAQEAGWLFGVTAELHLVLACKLNLGRHFKVLTCSLVHGGNAGVSRCEKAVQCAGDNRSAAGHPTP